jgi:SAM domain (Sterile alpha motif)
MDVAGWLRALGLEQYEAAFRENGVGAEDVCHLTAEDLEGLGVTPIGQFDHRSPGINIRGRTPPAHGDVLRSGGFDRR